MSNTIQLEKSINWPDEDEINEHKAITEISKSKQSCEAKVKQSEAEIKVKNIVYDYQAYLSRI